MDFKAEWLNDMFRSMENNLDNETKRKILSECRQTCSKYWAEKADEIRGSSQSADTVSLLNVFRNILPCGGPDIQVEGSKIHWSFSGGECPCPIGGITRNSIVCLCGIGHVKGMVEPLLGKKLTINLERSRLKGDSKCAFTIRISKTK